MLSSIGAFFAAIWSWFSGLSVLSKSLIATVVGLVIFSFITYVTLTSENNDLRSDNITIQNKLAETDSLHGVLLKDKTILSERFASQSKNLRKSEKLSAGLAARLKEKDATLLMYSQTIQETKLENLNLRGKMKKDSLGRTYANFDTTGKYFSFDADVYFKPKPRMRVQHMTIPDSTTVGMYQDGLYLRGFIAHSNPFVVDKGGSFTKQLDLSFNNSKVFSIAWYWAIPIYAVGFGTGYILK